MNKDSSRLALTFSAIGHFFFHYMAAMYFTLVISLAGDWSQPFHELIELWTPAFLLIGLVALPAGRLADRWSPAGMLVVMFIGMGLACTASSFAQNSSQLLILLAGIGLFAAIYHPVGISWLVQMSSVHTGKKLAINGIFGGLGAAAAGGVTGLLLQFFDWRTAFFIPGLACFSVGLVMFWYIRSGRLRDTSKAKDSEESGSAGSKGLLSAFLIMLLPMFTIGLIYNTTQAAMPKLFEEGLMSLLGGNIAKVGGMVSIVYAIGAIMQLFGGWLSDRFPLKLVYLCCWLLQVPLLLLIATSTNVVLLGLVICLVSLNTAALPPENILLSRFAPKKHQGVAFGIKFVLAFGAGPLGIVLIAWARKATGSFELLFYGLGISAAITAFVVLMLPRKIPPAEI
jgi:MFS transporter, FSR family, fosmidomycin resistance protein